MLVKFSNPGSVYTLQCDALSQEVCSNTHSRVKVFLDGNKIYDVLVGVYDNQSKTTATLDTCDVLCYERAYIMENGVTVDKIGR